MPRRPRPFASPVIPNPTPVTDPLFAPDASDFTYTAIGGIPAGRLSLPAIQLGGHFWQDNSLAHLNRGWAAALKSLGVAVHVPKPVKPLTEHEFLSNEYPSSEPFGESVYLRFAPAEKMNFYNSRPRLCLLDMADTWRVGGYLPVSLYNSQHRTVVLSRHDADFFKSRGVSNTVLASPGVDASFFHPDVPPIDLDEVFGPGYFYHRNFGNWRDAEINFLVSGHLQPRKGIARLLEAWTLFNRENENCCLLLKNCPGFWADHEGVRREIAAYEGKCNLRYSEAPISNREFARMMNASDIVVGLSHMEGFGLVPLQAMAMDKPVVVMNAHGYLEYSDRHNASLVESIPARNPMPDGAGFPWYDYKPEDAARAFEDAVKNRHCPMRSQQRRLVVSRFGWKESALQLLAAVDAPNPRPFISPARRRDLVTIIIAIKQGKRGVSDLYRLLDSIEEHETEVPYEIIVVDDGSSKPVEIPAVRSASVQLFRLQHNEGGASARNAAIMHGSGNYFMALDSDIEFKEPVLRKLIQRIGNNDRMILAPKLLHADGTIQSAGGHLWQYEGWANYQTAHRFDRRRGDTPAANVSCDIQYAPGACLFMSRNCVIKGGLYCEEYKAVNWEDVDLCYRVWANGGKVVYVPSVEMYHHFGSFTRTETLTNESSYTVNEKVFRRRFQYAHELIPEKPPIGNNGWVDPSFTPE